MGAIKRTGSIPTESELIMTAGRVFLISAPMVGSRLTNQISPRFGLAANEVSTAHASYFGIAGIAIKQFLSLFTQDSAAFSQRHAHEGRTIRLKWNNLFCSFTNRCSL
jgi:hypothetical protein